MLDCYLLLSTWNKRYILIFKITTNFYFSASHFWYGLHSYAEKICRHCTTDTTTKKVDIDVEWRAILERGGGRNFSRSHSMILRFLGHTMGWYISFKKAFLFLWLCVFTKFYIQGQRYANLKNFEQIWMILDKFE